MYIILDALTRMIAPILAYTSDEIWKYMPHCSDADSEHIIFNSMPEKIDVDCDTAKWDRIHELRDVVKKSIENVRIEKIIKTSLESKVTLKANKEEYDFLKSIESELATIFIVSQVVVEQADVAELTVEVTKASGEKCERCWAYSETVGTDSAHQTLCKRCADILNG
jgi:isoleucyl-tRNA synthetase